MGHRLASEPDEPDHSLYCSYEENLMGLRLVSEPD